MTKGNKPGVDPKFQTLTNKGKENQMNNMQNFNNNVMATAATATTTASLSTTTNGNLLGVYNFTLLTADGFTNVKRALNNSGKEIGDSTLVPTPKDRLSSLARQILADCRLPLVEYTIDIESNKGKNELKAVVNTGKRFAELPGRYFICGWYGKPGQVTLFLSTKAVDLFQSIGTKVCCPTMKDILKTCKRVKRAFARHEAMFTGRITAEGRDVFYSDLVVDPTDESKTVLLPADELHAYPATVLYVDFNGIKTSVLLPELPAAVAKHLEGAQVLDYRLMTKLLQQANPGVDAIRVHRGDGFKVTGLFRGGEIKGHGLVWRINNPGVGMILTDIKKEFVSIDDTFTFGLMQAIHKPRITRTDIQTVINFRLWENGFLTRWSKQYLIDQIKTKIEENNGQSIVDLYEKMTADQKPLASVDDILAAEEGATPEGKSVWALQRLIQQRVANPGHKLFDGFNAMVGLPELDVMGQPTIALRIFRHLTENVFNLTKLRIPVPDEEAVRGYAMFDPFCLGDGDGFYVRKGVLGSDIWVFGFEGPTCINRNPNGWIGEMSRGLRARKIAQLEQLEKHSPFIFIGAEIIVAVMATLGGGDLDDMLTAWIGSAIVEHLSAQQAHVDAYPQAELPVSKTAVVEAVNDEFTMKRTEREFVFNSSASIIACLNQLGQNEINIGTITIPGWVFSILVALGQTEGIHNLGGITRNQETVVDMGVKDGGSFAAIGEEIEKFYESVTRCPEFLFNRLPRPLRDSGKVVSFKSPVDESIDVIKGYIDRISAAFDVEFMHPAKAQRMLCMLTAVVRPEAEAVASSIWETYRSAFFSNKDHYAKLLADEAFDSVSEGEKLGYCIGQAYSKAASLAFDTFIRKGNRDRVFDFEVMAALYNNVMSDRRNTYIDETTGKVRRLPDAILWSPEFSALVIDAMLYFKNLPLFQVAAAPVEEKGTGRILEALKVRPAFIAHNGIQSKLTKGEWTVDDHSKWLDMANANIPVILRALDPENEEDRAFFGDRKPVRCIVVLRNETTLKPYGFILNAQIEPCMIAMRGPVAAGVLEPIENGNGFNVRVRLQ